MPIKFPEILKTFLKVFFEIEHIEKSKKIILFFKIIVIAGWAAFKGVYAIPYKKDFFWL